MSKMSKQAVMPNSWVDDDDEDDNDCDDGGGGTFLKFA